MQGMGSIAATAALIAMALTASPTRAGGQVDGSDAIFIVGAIHGLHETEESFGYRQLRELIQEIEPDVMLLEVRPDELAERKETPGRPEYPAVVWPMLEEADIVAIPMEPGGELFTQMVTKATHLAEAFESFRPDEHSFWTSYGKSLDLALQQHWTTLAETHDRVTADLMRSRSVLIAALSGETWAAGQGRWDAYMVDRAREAIEANPGKKILVLGSYRNRHVFVDQLKEKYGPRVVDMERWLASTKG
jgi:hypothetical protein